jgi:hypothetical protein
MGQRKARSRRTPLPQSTDRVATGLFFEVSVAKRCPQGLNVKFQ